MDEHGNWYDAQGRHIANPNQNPNLHRIQAHKLSSNPTQPASQSTPFQHPTNQPVDPGDLYGRLGFNPGGQGHWGIAFDDPQSAFEAHGFANDAKAATANEYKTQNLHNNEVDAFRHGLWSYKMAKPLGADRAKSISDAHEISSENPDDERLMDLYNNKVGRDLARIIHDPWPKRVANVA
ncbi:hypothetical protein [Magnetospira sp. QH-2]|uniref:DUF6973 domain-containing protein n=1 Tax=Magnetospira sp. (strain QH-2) TaxID=1288970 RepID=UPI0011DDC8D6|nr:hypothetical protein [Magnetospira sp. QH-2]